MRSNDTFSDEYESLSSVPEVFYTDPFGARGPDDSVVPERYRSPTLVADNSTNSRPDYEGDASAPRHPVDLSVIAASVAGGASSDIVVWLRDEVGLNVELAWETLSGDEVAKQRVAAGVAQLGAEFYAVYLPWHQYARSEVTPWGMYFKLERILIGAVRMAERARRQGKELTRDQAVRLAFFVPYRHELFHFHVERFATRHEVLTRRAIYKPYDYGVFRAAAGTSRWLEEALANAVVLESKFVKNRIGLDSKALRKLIGAEFDEMPPGYRDYHSKEFGGPDQAHRLFAAQIVSAVERPAFASTDLAIPKTEYGVDSRKVPGYLTYRADFLARFQFATPEMRKVQAWMQRAGFSRDGAGPGDHERWKHDVSGQVVQLNRQGKECDLASLKAVARVLGTSVGKLAQTIRAS